ncbi:MAG: prepilin peptidase [Candidatus Omnitrophica bacterium]|nr:prepilin peptidase [Candidatus Omnitrophota bacterium]
MKYFLVFVSGTIIGSFLNVCIYRIPLGKSVVWPGSHCTFCRKPIRWYDNIPLISYLILKGKCRNCGTPIPLRYFIVELVTALSGVLLLYYFSLSPAFFVYWFFTCSLIVIMAIDIEHQEIPDSVSIPGIVLGLVLATVFRLTGGGTYPGAFLDSVLGVLAGGGSMFVLGVVGELVFKKEALGGGDVKLMAMIGAFLGWKLVMLTFFMAPVLGAGVGLFMKLRFGKEEIAYGPYLSLGAFISLLYGEKILDYLFLGL